MSGRVRPAVLHIEAKTNLGSRTGDASNIPFPNFSFLSGRTLDENTLLMAFPIFLYEFIASSPKPRNTKTTTEDTGMAHQDSNIRLRDRGLISIQT